MADQDRLAGWAAAGAFLMIIMGGFRAISGFIALFNDEWIVRGTEGYMFVDITALAWWMIAIGALLVLAGLAILAGQTWGRIVGIAFAILALISELLWLPAYPFWSIIGVVLYSLVLYAFIVVRIPTSE